MVFSCPHVSERKYISRVLDYKRKKITIMILIKSLNLNFIQHTNTKKLFQYLFLNLDLNISNDFFLLILLENNAVPLPQQVWFIGMSPAKEAELKQKATAVNSILSFIIYLRVK